MNQGEKRILVDAREFTRGRLTGIGRVLIGLLGALAASADSIELVLALQDNRLLPTMFNDRKNIKTQIVPPSFWRSEIQLSQLSRRGFSLFISPYPKLPFFGCACASIHIIHDVLDLTHPAYKRRLKANFDRYRLKRALSVSDLTWYDSTRSLSETQRNMGSAGRNPRMGFLMSWLRARSTIGHDAKGFGLFLDKKVAKEIFENRHFSDAMMDLTKLAGGVPDDRGIEVFWDKSVEAKLANLFPKEAQEIKPLCIGINPGADRPEKRWSPENHASVTDRLVELRGATVFLFGGPSEENLADRIEKAMKHPATNLAGKLSLNELAYVISRLDLLVTNDSGPMHIAAAVKTPVVALFSPEDPVYTRPCTSPNLYRIVRKELHCRPCTKKRCDRPICMESLKPEDVLQACLDLLDQA